MHGIKMLTDMFGALGRKWKLSIGNVIQTLKYGILMGKIMEGSHSREGERLVLEMQYFLRKLGGIKK